MVEREDWPAFVLCRTSGGLVCSTGQCTIHQVITTNINPGSCLVSSHSALGLALPSMHGVLTHFSQSCSATRIAMPFWWDSLPATQVAYAHAPSPQPATTCWYRWAESSQPTSIARTTSPCIIVATACLSPSTALLLRCLSSPGCTIHGATVPGRRSGMR